LKLEEYLFNYYKKRKMKIAVLGAGMVGRTIAIDLSSSHEVNSFDISETNLEKLKPFLSIKTTKANLADYENYASILQPFDMVVCAVPGFMGYKTLEAIIYSGKNVADISFFPEDGLQLDSLAKEKNVTAIIDCGVAPGMSNLILGYYNAQMKIDSFECMVGGLPKKRVKPFEYKAPFSPVDVIEEYTRPARYVENGHVVTKPALSDAELINFDYVGTLESFNTDGLRSILHTMKHIPDMKEKTLRYPGHISIIQSLQQAGFFNVEEINVMGKKIIPLEVTTAILFNQWKLGAAEAEFTIMKIIIKGENKTIDYLLYDEFDVATQTASMSRTTGYACNAFANMIADNVFTEKGIFPPELVGKDKKCFEFVMSYLTDRNVVYKKTVY
jgi:lysine 6-dehydrogenase